MIDIKTLEVAGIRSAIYAMRNPYDSWDKSDSCQATIGEKDKELSEKLSKAGTEHCKHLRMCIVWADISAPLYWWKEFDTYRTGVEKLSCSTMHTITKKPFSAEMFTSTVGSATIAALELTREAYIQAKENGNDEMAHEFWRRIIENLPSGFIQRRTVMMSYAALRQICKQRKGHKLAEWEAFRRWAFSLPEAWMIGGDEE